MTDQKLDDGEAWSFCRKVIGDGRDIAMWHHEEGYERHSARMDAMAAMRGDQLMAMVAALRADRDSLHDALAAIVPLVEEFYSELGLSEAEWKALEMARHVLGEKRA